LGLDNEKIKARLLLAGVSEQLVVGTISAHSLAGSAIRDRYYATIDFSTTSATSATSASANNKSKIIYIGVVKSFKAA
jgi:hypothetical protein